MVIGLVVAYGSLAIFKDLFPASFGYETYVDYCYKILGPTQTSVNKLQHMV